VTGRQFNVNEARICRQEADRYELSPHVVSRERGIGGGRQVDSSREDICWLEAAEAGCAVVSPIERAEDVNREQSEETSKHWHRRTTGTTPMEKGSVGGH
jgi:hypothetical protein